MSSGWAKPAKPEMDCAHPPKPREYSAFDPICWSRKGVEYESGSNASVLGVYSRLELSLRACDGPAL